MPGTLNLRLTVVVVVVVAAVFVVDGVVVGVVRLPKLPLIAW